MSMNFIRWVFEKTLLVCSAGGGGGGGGGVGVRKIGYRKRITKG